MKKIEKSEKTREKIITKTFELISAKGIERLTHREVARKSGMSLGLVHKYLGPSKKLVYFLMTYVVEKGYAILLNPPSNLTVIEKILYNQEKNLKFFLSNRGYGMVFLYMNVQSRYDRRMHQLNKELVARAELRINNYLHELTGRDQSELARFIHSFLVGEVIKYTSMKLTDVDSFIKMHIIFLTKSLESLKARNIY